jgi:hypothetical protein
MNLPNYKSKSKDKEKEEERGEKNGHFIYYWFVFH